jgi:hypothetical protein
MLSVVAVLLSFEGMPSDSCCAPGTLYPSVQGVVLSFMAVLLFEGGTADSWCSGDALSIG